MKTTTMRSFRLDDRIELLIRRYAVRFKISDTQALQRLVAKGAGVPPPEKPKVGKRVNPDRKMPGRGRARPKLVEVSTTGRSGDGAPTTEHSNNGKVGLGAMPPNAQVHSPVPSAPAPITRRQKATARGMSAIEDLADSLLKQKTEKCPRCGKNLIPWGPLMKRCTECQENFTPMQIAAVVQKDESE